MPGYNVTAVTAVHPGHFCPHCGFILRDAVQSEEGHRLCGSCYDEISCEPGCACHCCGISLRPNEQVFPDRAVRREIFKLLVKCDNHVFGCPWVAELKHFEEHCQQCQYKQCRVSGEEDTAHKVENLPPHESPQDKMTGASERALKQMERKQRETAIQTSQDKIKSLETTVKQQRDRIEQLEKEVQTARPRHCCIETHDTTVTLKIPDVSRRLIDALIQPFYIRYGYKMCLLVYLTGVGTGLGTHISIGLALMKGVHDSMLKWPFQRIVSISLVDQDGHDHIVKTFMPDQASPCFQRPTSNMNIASMFPRFARISVLRKKKYVKDDVMYVKCVLTPVDEQDESSPSFFPPDTHNSNSQDESSPPFFPPDTHNRRIDQREEYFQFYQKRELLRRLYSLWLQIRLYSSLLRSDSFFPLHYSFLKFDYSFRYDTFSEYDTSPEYEIFRRWCDCLVELTKHGINTLANQALAHQLIAEEVYEKATHSEKPLSERARAFYDAIRSQIKLCPEALAKFLSILKREPAYNNIVRSIEAAVRNRRSRNTKGDDDLYMYNMNYVPVPEMFTQLHKPIECNPYPSTKEKPFPTTNTICPLPMRGYKSLTFSFLLYLYRHNHKTESHVPRYSASMIVSTQSRRCTLTFELTNETSLYLASHFPRHSEVFALGVINIRLPMFPRLEPRAQLVFFPMPHGFDLTEHRDV